MKTRLAARVGGERAASIYRRLVAYVCGSLRNCAEVAVMFDPMERRDEVVEWITPLCRVSRFAPQALGNLGARLEAAFAAAFAHGYEQVAAIGSDCIELDDAIFARAWAALDEHDGAIGPTHDGGYYLIALRKPCATLFREITWSSRMVFSQTMERAREAGLRMELLPALYDVDTEEDWRRAELRLPS